MIKYRENLAQSAEYLRLALPLMSRQAAGLHPISYAVWYEYVAGINRPLKEAIDKLTAGGKVLDEEATAELYRRYVAELDDQTARQVSAGFQKVLADVSRSAAQAGDHAEQFGSVLEQWSEGLEGSAPSSGVDNDVGRLLVDTRVMQGAIGTLKGQLEASRREIETLRHQVDRAREDALADGLTGLVNRKGFDLALAACLESAAPDTQGPSLLMTDIDFFKKVNDNYGHLFGDKVLRSVAQILKQNVKGKDTAARYGGEEFVILLPDTPLGGAKALAERIRLTIEGSRIKRTDTNELLAKVTVSVGVASYRSGESALEFVGRADEALYESKSQGRNRVTLAA